MSVRKRTSRRRNPTSGHARIQRLMREHVKSTSNGSRIYVENSAIPMPNGVWLYYSAPYAGGKAREEHVQHRDLVRRTVSNPAGTRRRNPWPSKYKTQGAKYDRCLAKVGPGYNPFAVCGASMEKTMGKKKFGEMLSAKRRMAKRPKRNPAWSQHPALYAPTIHGQVRVQKPRMVGAPGPVRPVSGPVRMVRTKVIQLRNNPTEPLDAEELVLYAHDGDLYRKTRQKMEQALLEMYIKGKYTHAVGHAVWFGFAKEAAQKYRRDIDPNARFSRNEILRAAMDMNKTWEAEMPHAAKYYTGPAGTRHNPRRRR